MMEAICPLAHILTPYIVEQLVQHEWRRLLEIIITVWPVVSAHSSSPTRYPVSFIDISIRPSSHSIAISLTYENSQ